jgi:hypothetical protein
VLGDALREEHQLLFDSENITLLQNETLNQEDSNNCGNCYGAGTNGECCNTCDEVKQAYERKGWHLQPQEISQCQNRLKLDNWKDQFADTGGCQLYGHLELNKASGHFHISPHKNLKHAGNPSGLADFLELIAFTFSQFNISHTINSLRIGDQYPGLLRLRRFC